uniref:Uncharacterized protein n=1 Tax=Percolomonas cosmopolitus TaxID=63605 RepID=A0A7S1KTJ8_9EUKA|mmetsp:Transcript_9007/g.33214  ORF Transcript_9007/g.33214 Transcript_9007/m.33214 type:complete len:469 (+) Transcript_9007:199-1605(+)
MSDSPYWRIFNTIGTLFTVISLLSTIFVISTILIRRCVFKDLGEGGGAISHASSHTSESLQHEKSKKRVMNLYQYTIFGLLISDLMFGIAYMPSQISWLIFVTYKDLKNTALQSVVTIGSELAESFFIASGLWSLAIALSVWIGIQRVVSKQKLRISVIKQRPRSGSLVESRSDMIPSPQKMASKRSSQSAGASSISNSTFRNLAFSPLSAKGTHSPMSPLQVKPHHHHHYRNGALDEAFGTSNLSRKSSSNPVVNLCRGVCRLPKRTRFWITLFAFGLPLISWVFWATTNMWLQVYAPSAMWQHITFIVSDTYHTAVYIAIELATILLRILIYLKVKSLFDQTKAVMWKNTPQAHKMNQEKRKFFRQSILYSLPFLISGTCLVVARTWIDVEVIIKISSRGIDGKWSNEEFTTAAMVLLSIHRCIFPLRGFMDSLVYCWMSNWFRSTFKTCRVWSRRSDEEKARLLS